MFGYERNELVFISITMFVKVKENEGIIIKETPEYNSHFLSILQVNERTGMMIKEKHLDTSFHFIFFR